MATTTTSTPIISDSATSAALVSSTTDGLRQLVALLGAVITSAQADLADPLATRISLSAARQAISQATLAQNLFRAQLGPPPARARARVLPGDTLYSIAQAYYGGNVFAYRQVVLANNLTSPIVNPGDVLLLPAVG